MALSFENSTDLDGLARLCLAERAVGGHVLVRGEQKTDGNGDDDNANDMRLLWLGTFIMRYLDSSWLR